MEHHGHDAFYPIEQSSTAGNSRDQLRQAASWKASVTIGSHPPHRTPRTQNTNETNDIDVYPLVEPGSLSCVNPSQLQRPVLDLALPQGHACLDDLDLLKTGSAFQNLGFQGQFPSNYLQSISPTELISQLFVPIPQSTLQYPVPSHSRLHMTPPVSTPGDDGRQVLHHFPSTLESSTLHPAVPLGLSGKRSRESNPQATSDVDGPARRPSKAPRIEHLHNEARKSNSYNHSRNRTFYQEHEQRLNRLSLEPRGYTLEIEQKDFIKQWFKSFSKGSDKPKIATEEINAFATLIKAHPQAIRDYVSDDVSDRMVHLSSNPLLLSSTQAGGPGERTRSQQGYILREANRHLDGETLELVERYVVASQRRRAQSDGRRSVNAGHFLCTFDCGYRTKRTFDWRRHEETHEPQELWLCHLCRQNRESGNPFLVNRKDKFLKHAKDSHKGTDPDEILEISRVDFQANFDPICPICGEHSPSWDERCKHITAHYEDDEHLAKSRRRTQAHLGGRSDIFAKGSIPKETVSASDSESFAGSDTSPYFKTHHGSDQSP